MTSCHETATRTGKDGDDASLGEDGAVPPTVAEGRRSCRSLTGRGSADSPTRAGGFGGHFPTRPCLARTRGRQVPAITAPMALAIPSA